MSRNKGKSLCVFSAKGGVGKTTCLLNLAGIFSCLEKKVLVIDLDQTSGSVATYLNKKFTKTIYNYVDDYLNNRYENISAYATKFNDFIFFLPASKDPRQGSKIAPSMVSVIIEKAIYEYDIVLVDTTHALNEFNVNILDSCDETLLVVTNDLLDLKNTRNLIQIFKSAQKENYKVLLNYSINPNKKYYSLYDVKNIIKANIDYTIEAKFHIKTMDYYVADGKIITLEAKMNRIYPKVFKTFNVIASDICGE